MTERIREVYVGPKVPLRAGDDAVWYKTGYSTLIPVYKVNGLWNLDPPVRAIRATVVNSLQVHIVFSDCLEALSALNVQTQINGGDWRDAALIVNGGPDNFIRIQTSGIELMESGDDVSWQYITGNRSLVACTNGDDLASQQITVHNPL